jgi:hypothetical protein
MTLLCFRAEGAKQSSRRKKGTGTCLSTATQRAANTGWARCAYRLDGEFATLY